MAKTNALAPRMSEIKALLTSEAAITAVAQVLPHEGLKPRRICRLASYACSQNDALAKNCTPKSILTSTIKAAMLGLDVGGASGLAYLVPFGDQAQLVVGYMGYVDLARRAGVTLEAGSVFKGDDFHWEQGLESALSIIPGKDVDRTDFAELTHTWAVARFASTTNRRTVSQMHPVYGVLTRAEVLARRKRSKSANKGAWSTDPIRMAEKSAVRALARFLPRSWEIVSALELDNRADGAEPSTYIDTDSVQDVTTADDIFGEAPETIEVAAEPVEPEPAEKAKPKAEAKAAEPETAKPKDGKDYGFSKLDVDTPELEEQKRVVHESKHHLAEADSARAVNAILKTAMGRGLAAGYLIKELSAAADARKKELAK